MGVIVILKNSRNQSFSFEINGRTAKYLGKGNLHPKQYEYLMKETGYGAVLGLENVPQDINETSGSTQCFYNVQVFPSTAMEDHFKTNTPMLFSISLASIFCFTSLVFLFYDSCVARRHRKVQDSAAKSGAVVRSLFPLKVVSRLYESTDHSSSRGGDGGRHDGFRNKSRDVLSPTGEFLIDDDLHRGHPTDPHGSLGVMTSSNPIADLYPDCTVFFADIVGFTKWSSDRQPTEVFRFLETLYSAFDHTANHLDVFKVETIGDCYVAVTGLPHRQSNHATRLVHFAAECMIQMNQVVHKLVPLLGPETASLSMRAGLHSGPVTVGILRGEKARCKCLSFNLCSS